MAPARRITLTVALKLNETVMTSSPGPMPSACSTASWATVPLLISTACLTPQYAAQASSKAVVLRPMASMPDRRTSRTASSSAGPMSGLEIGIIGSSGGQVATHRSPAMA